MFEVYRFRDKVAINIDGKGTVYMTEETAGELAVALLRGASDCRNYQFTESRFSPARITQED